MSTTLWIAAASIAAVVVSALAVLAGLRSVRDQLRVTVFLTYTERYSKVMAGLPFEARQPGSGYSVRSQPREERTRVLIAFREYFNLCSEEMWLHRHRRIDRATWRVWLVGMREVARFPSFAEAWDELGTEYACYPEFQNFIRELLPITVPTADVHERVALRPVSQPQPEPNDPT